MYLITERSYYQTVGSVIMTKLIPEEGETRPPLELRAAYIDIRNSYALVLCWSATAQQCSIALLWSHDLLSPRAYP